MSDRHPWTRFVAIGDSFTEGIGDPDPSSVGGHRGWADRVADALADGTDEDFAYANLAVRGRLLRQIVDEQVEAALALGPDLVTVSAGGNDVIRPGSDPDELAERYDGMVEQLRRDGATVVLFTGPDVGTTPVLGMVRGKTAVYNEHLHAIALKHGALVTNLWALRVLRDPRMWAPDRLHHSPLGHATVAAAVLDTLGVPHALGPSVPEPLAARPWREARVEDLGWAKEYLVPWVVRRVRGTSSGDGVTAKRTTLQPVTRRD
ncbi:SGNH/GDSL hydrolase family protein [Curtobacterium sp. MCJR17_055]|uniref:SGNH/GDSL hydrolase family protein n=1 Tax=unclassified Curtobacterium TaxID=257496 RepID=UPI000DA0E4CC|nr:MULTISPECIES: SGNH/GDSL hydrolase family protein [unclassified Curtobacterium]PYY35080.1 SGNH/GDSL hydrolase family protein [Curtobacterium sp. MCBD17_029]PYY55640.1 SGNH/GDSL hydrolase family protein [Curtobacterium sp. MCJR17_055]PYY60385.1 SGNH/GDSL hydrolase family protein [Curtobacterium sp. MCPF17_015]